MNVPVNRVKITGPAVMVWTCLHVDALRTLPGWCANWVNKIKTEKYTAGSQLKCKLFSVIICTNVNVFTYHSLYTYTASV